MSPDKLDHKWNLPTQSLHINITLRHKYSDENVQRRTSDSRPRPSKSSQSSFPDSIWAFRIFLGLSVRLCVWSPSCQNGFDWWPLRDLLPSWLLLCFFLVLFPGCRQVFNLGFGSRRVGLFVSPPKRRIHSLNTSTPVKSGPIDAVQKVTLKL